MLQLAPDDGPALIGVEQVGAVVADDAGRASVDKGLDGGSRLLTGVDDGAGAVDVDTAVQVAGDGALTAGDGAGGVDDDVGPQAGDEGGEGGGVGDVALVVGGARHAVALAADVDGGDGGGGPRRGAAVVAAVQRLGNDVVAEEAVAAYDDDVAEASRRRGLALAAGGRHVGGLGERGDRGRREGRRCMKRGFCARACRHVPAINVGPANNYCRVVPLPCTPACPFREASPGEREREYLPRELGRRYRVHPARHTASPLFLFSSSPRSPLARPQSYSASSLWPLVRRLVSAPSTSRSLCKRLGRHETAPPPTSCSFRLGMAGQSPPQVEILVHVTAPSRAADDGPRRQLARAYLAFEPAARTALPEVPAITSSLSAPEKRSLFAGPDSQDLSFRSALDNRSSPRLRPSRPPPTSAAPVPFSSQGDESRALSPSSFCAPASQVSDSYPLPDASVFTATPTRVLRRYLSNGNSSSYGSTGTSTSVAPSPPSPLDADVIDVPSSLPVPNRQHEPPPPPYHASLANHVVPATPVAAPAPPPRSRRAVEEPATSALLDVTHISSSFVSHRTASSPSRVESEPPPPRKRPRITSHADGDSLALVRSTSDAGPPTTTADCATADEDALEIRPPSPPPGTAQIDPASLVSDELAKLARVLSSRYRPEPACRTLEPFERGYWLLDCSGWPPQARRDTWVFLTNYLRSGLAGWGVWCRRGGPASEQQRQHAWIRLYCWACVAKHTYLLLYLASGRHVKTTGAAWFGADGKVALEVAPSKARRPTDASA